MCAATDGVRVTLSSFHLRFLPFFFVRRRRVTWKSFVLAKQTEHFAWRLPNNSHDHKKDRCFYTLCRMPCVVCATIAAKQKIRSKKRKTITLRSNRVGQPHTVWKREKSTQPLTATGIEHTFTHTRVRTHSCTAAHTHVHAEIVECVRGQRKTLIRFEFINCAPSKTEIQILEQKLKRSQQIVRFTYRWWFTSCAVHFTSCIVGFGHLHRCHWIGLIFFHHLREFRREKCADFH